MARDAWNGFWGKLYSLDGSLAYLLALKAVLNKVLAYTTRNILISGPCHGA